MKSTRIVLCDLPEYNWIRPPMRNSVYLSLGSNLGDRFFGKRLDVSQFDGLAVDGHIWISYLSM